MSKPQRIQLKRTNGWNMQEASRQLNGLEAVNVTRPGFWGNPVNGEYPVVEYWLWIESQFPYLETQMHLRKEVLRRLPELRGKNLACWCPLFDEKGNPVACHADVLLELANREEAEANAKM